MTTNTNFNLLITIIHLPKTKLSINLGFCVLNIPSIR